MQLAAAVGALMAGVPDVGATLYSAVITSTPPGLSGPAILAFDYVDGGSPDNTVVLDALGGNWVPAPTPATPSDLPAGAICGADPTCSPPWTFAESAPPNSFYELQVPFSAIGTALSFSFTTTDNAPDAGSFPDSFSFFILDPATGFPLFPTDDPGGALFSVSIAGTGPCGDSLCVFPPDPSIDGFSITVTPVAPAPEPGSIALLGAGFIALFVRRRMR